MFSVAGRRRRLTGIGGLRTTQGHIPANILDERKKFAGCGSKGELFWDKQALWHDHEIQSRRQEGLMQPETFPEHPFDAIAHDCRSDFLSNRHSDAPIRFIGRTKTDKHDKVLAEETATFIVAEREIRSPEQSVPTRPG